MSLVILTLILSMSISTHADVPPGVTVDRDLVYATVDGKDLKLDVYWHPDATKPMPLIVWVHGGAWRKGSKKNPRAKGLLDKRYAVASVQYRLSQEAIFPAQIHDCKAAIRWLRSNAAQYKVDPDRFGVWGVSAGGHLVALLGTSGDVEELEGDLGVTGVSSRVQAVSDWYGPTDFLRMNDIPGKIDHDPADSPESQLIGAPIQDHPDLVTRANPITYASPDDPPFLIMHGAADLTVLPNQSTLLHAALQDTGVPTNLIIIDDVGHGFASKGKAINDTYRHVEAFFDRVLRSTNSAWISPDTNPHPWVSDTRPNIPGVHDVLYFSERIGGYHSYQVYLPDVYDDPLNEQTYPTVYWLHGRGGRPRSSNGFISRAHDAISAGLCPPMVIVTPTGIRSSMYVDSKDGKYPVASVIFEDLIPHVESTYRVYRDREMRAIDGFSMGGYGAAHLGFKHPEVFGTISMMGAAIHKPEFFRSDRADIFANAFGDDLEYCDQQSPWTLVRQNAELLRNRTTMRLFVGENDSRLRAKNVQFSVMMETLQLRHDHGVVPEAGHNVRQVLEGIGEETAWGFYAKAFKVE